MIFRTKLLLDRIVGTPAMLLMNVVVYLVGKIIRRDHSINESNIRIIAIQKIVGMGSIIEFSPCLRAIKRTYPKASIIFVSSLSNRELLSMYRDYIDDFVFIDDKTFLKLLISSFRAILKLIAKKIDLFLNLEVYSSFSTFISISSLARNRFGFYIRSATFRKALDTHHIFYNQHKNIREIYSNMIKAAGCKSFDKDDLIKFNISENIIQKVNKYLSQNNINKYILININASELSLERRWPESKWIKLIKLLIDKTGHEILLPGSANERDYIQKEIVNKIEKEYLKYIFNIAGQLTIEEFVYIIRQCLLFITVDSGPYHLGVSEDINMISLWGPENPFLYGMSKHNQSFIYKHLYCSPCIKQTDSPPCKGSNICMKNIKVDEVMENVMNLLRN